MLRGQHLPADHTKGDESTIGGYAAVHDRPAAFEGPDGCSYSVELMSDFVGATSSDESWAGFFLFVRWARIGAQSPEGHLESDYVVRATSEDEARRALGRTPLIEVKSLLDRLVGQSSGESTSPRGWLDAVRDEPVE